MDVDPSEWLPFAEGHLDCSICGDSVPVLVLSRLVGDPGDFRLDVTADLSEVWLHWWTHDVTVGDAADEQ